MYFIATNFFPKTMEICLSKVLSRELSFCILEQHKVN